MVFLAQESAREGRQDSPAAASSSSGMLCRDSIPSRVLSNKSVLFPQKDNQYLIPESVDLECVRYCIVYDSNTSSLELRIRRRYEEEDEEEENDNEETGNDTPRELFLVF